MQQKNDNRQERQNNNSSVQQLPMIPITLPEDVQRKLQEQIEILYKQQFTIEDFPQILTHIQSEDLILQHWALTALRNMVSENNIQGLIQQVLNANLVKKLIEIIDFAMTPIHVYEALWVLSNLLSGNAQQTESIIYQGGIYLFVKLLSSPYKDIAEQAVWAIGNIAGECTKYRDIIIILGGVDLLIQILNTATQKKTIKHCTWSLSNLCRGTPIADFRYVKNALPVFCRIIIDETDFEVLSDACWALSYLSDGENPRLQQVIDSGVVPTLIKLLDHPQILFPTLRILKNIVQGNELQIQYVVELGLLTIIPQLLCKQSNLARLQTCYILQRITRENPKLVSQVAQDSDILKILFEQILYGTEDIKKEVNWILYNLTKHGSNQDIEILVQNGLIIRYIQILLSHDIQKFIVVLNSLYNVLRRGDEFPQENPYLAELKKFGGVTLLEELEKKYTQNQDVFIKPYCVFGQFYESEIIY